MKRTLVVLDEVVVPKSKLFSDTELYTYGRRVVHVEDAERLVQEQAQVRGSLTRKTAMVALRYVVDIGWQYIGLLAF